MLNVLQKPLSTAQESTSSILYIQYAAVDFSQALLCKLNEAAHEIYSGES